MVEVPARALGTKLSIDAGPTLKMRVPHQHHGSCRGQKRDGLPVNGPSETTPDVQTILVADDDPDLVRLLGRRLVRAGYDMITAQDGKEALEMVEQWLPEVVVLDVMMPKLTGIEVMHELRSNPETADIPVILISAGYEADNPAIAGADDFIRKPFGAQELPERVEAVLRSRDAAAD